MRVAARTAAPPRCRWRTTSRRREAVGPQAEAETGGALPGALTTSCSAPATLAQIGQAIHAGRGLFLYGQPGNGKTSIAERIIRAVSQHIWIPRTITVTGEIIRLFDPANHEEAPLTDAARQAARPAPL